MRVYIDEAGRWPLAGPVTVGLITYAPPFSWDKKAKQRNHYWRELNDSKQLSEKTRIRLFEHIVHDQSVVALTVDKSAAFIDQHGIITALREAICQWLWKLVITIKSSTSTQSYRVGKLIQYCKELEIECVIDGNHDFGLRKKLGIAVTPIIKGDSLIKEISAASICAKVVRDRYMIRQAQHFPCYGFEQHKGYGTAYHRAMIQQHGLCTLHRVSYCHNKSDINH